MAASKTISFTIEEVINDNAPPVVSTQTIANAQADVLPTVGNVKFTFDKALDSQTINADNITITKSDGAAITGAYFVKLESSKIVAVSFGDLEEATSYVISFSNAVKSVFGTQMQAYTTDFMTKSLPSILDLNYNNTTTYPAGSTCSNMSSVEQVYPAGSYAELWYENVSYGLANLQTSTTQGSLDAFNSFYCINEEDSGATRFMRYSRPQGSTATTYSGRYFDNGNAITDDVEIDVTFRTNKENSFYTSISTDKGEAWLYYRVGDQISAANSSTWSHISTGIPTLNDQWTTMKIILFRNESNIYYAKWYYLSGGKYVKACEDTSIYTGDVTKISYLRFYQDGGSYGTMDLKELKINRTDHNSLSPNVLGANAQTSAIGTNPLEIYFSKSMDSASINATTISITDKNNISVPVSVSYDETGRKAIVTPTAAWDLKNTYKATISANVKSLQNFAIGTDTMISFSTSDLSVSTSKFMVAGGEISTIFQARGKEVCVSSEINNYTTTTVKAILVMACYEYGKLLNVSVVPLEVANKATGTDEVSLNIPSTADSVKYFVWSSDNLRPLDSLKELN